MYNSVVLESFVIEVQVYVEESQTALAHLSLLLYVGTTFCHNTN